jgi:hypothetical protein
VGSYCSIYANGRRRFMTDVDLHEVGAERVGELERIAQRAAAARAAADPARFVDVQYAQLMTDPLGVVEQIYAAGAVDLAGGTCDAIRAWLAANPQNKGGRHTYDLGDYGLDPDDIRERFATA